MVAFLRSFRQFSKSRFSALSDSKGGRKRILAYLKLFVGEVVAGPELAIVSGIQESQRRIRELRREQGYNISSGLSRDGLRPDDYVLESADPDAEAAKKWATANKIRKMAGDARDRILELLKAHVGKPVQGEQIAYVAKVRETGRRIRELRREFGWRIVTRQTGRPDLPPSVYILESLDQLEEHDRHIPDNTYDEVLARDKHSCRKCGWGIERRHSSERRQFLEIHHIDFHAKGGTNEPTNLVTLCNVHHDDVHRQKLEGALLRKWIAAR